MILEQPLFGGKKCDVEKMEKIRMCTDKLEKCKTNLNIVIGSIKINGNHYF